MMKLLLIFLFATRAFAVSQIVPAGWQTSGDAAIATANRAYCVRFPAGYDSTGTKLSGYIVTGNASYNCSIGIYPDGDSSTKLAVVSSASCTTGSYVKNTGLTINLTRGTMYRLCMCADNTGLSFLTTKDEIVTNHMTAPLNGVGTYLGYSSNCTSGVLNDTTGALTADSTSTEAAPIAWVEE